jgi:hypothetical protein
MFGHVRGTKPSKFTRFRRVYVSQTLSILAIRLRGRRPHAGQTDNGGPRAKAHYVSSKALPRPGSGPLPLCGGPIDKKSKPSTYKLPPAF